MKKFVSVLLCLVMAMSLCTVAFANATDNEWVTVKFDADGGTVAVESKQFVVDSGIAVVKGNELPTAAKAGYIFKHWSDGTEKGVYPVGTADDEYWINVKPGATEILLVAVYDKCNANTFHYEYNGDGTHKVICDGCNEVNPADAACIWNFEGYETTECACGSTKPVSKTYTISYAPDADNMFNLVATDVYYDQNKYVATDSVTILDIAESAKTKAAAKGYKFVGWAGYVDLEGNTWDVIKPGAVLNIDRDTTLTAVWEKVETPKTYHVSYNWGELQINDGNEKGQLDAAKAPVDANEYTARTVIVVKEPFDNKNVVATDVVGYVFAGWMVNGDKEYIVQPGETLMVTGDMTLTAVWTKVDCQHSFVTYKADKGTRTHSATCDECGAVVVDHEKHSYDKKGVCTKCGAKKPASSKGGSTTTTTTTKSPKTGDMGVVLYAATALLSLSGTAVVIKKRKNDK